MIKQGDRVLCLRARRNGSKWLPGTVLDINPQLQAYQAKLDAEQTPGWFYYTEIKKDIDR